MAHVTDQPTAGIDLIPLTAETLIGSLRLIIDAQRPAFIWGNPGIGKSDVVRQLAAIENAHLIDLRASQWDAVDTRGIPYVTDTHGTAWAIPEIFPSEEFAAQHPMVIIFLDELNSAVPSVQAALYQLILDRRLGDYVLPANVRILAAGNLDTDRGVTHRMATPLKDRFVHFLMTVDNSSWTSWALDRGIHTAVIAFLQFRPDRLHAWDAKSASMSQPTPRGWEYISDLLKSAERLGINGEVERAAYTGKLGSEVGTEFLGFLRIMRDLPNPDAIIMAPDSADVSQDAAVNWAVCGALAAKVSVDNIDNVLRYADRLRYEASPEFGVLLGRTCIARNPDVAQTRGFIKWASDNQDLLI